MLAIPLHFITIFSSKESWKTFGLKGRCIVSLPRLHDAPIFYFQNMQDIPGKEGKYAITRDGRVWSYPKKVSNRMTQGKFLISTISKGKNRKDGYLCVKLGRGCSVTIHSLVANAFVPNPDNLPCVDHDDNNKLNNNYWNLKWVTYAENNIKSHNFYDNKPWQCNAKKIGQFSKDGELISEYNSVIEASRIVGGNKTAIAICARGLSQTSGGFIWKYL